MNETYKVSILIPVYGVEKYIERCARSVFEQTYQNLEIIFVDDCTPDYSIEVLKRVLEEYPERKGQVKIIHHEKNRGSAVVRNTAMENATGEFVSSVDSDDWLERDAIELLVQKQQEDDADIVSADGIINEDTVDQNYVNPPFKTKHDFLQLLLTQNYHHEVWGRLIRRSLYTDHDIKCLEGYNVGEDWYVMPRLIWYAQKLSWIPKGLYHYRITDTSYCHSEKTAEQQKNYLYQSYVNQFHLCQFFRDKDDHLFQSAQQYAIFCCYYLMTYVLPLHDRVLFERLRVHLSSNYGSSAIRQRLGSKVAFLLHSSLSYYLLPKYLRLVYWWYDRKNEPLLSCF